MALAEVDVIDDLGKQTDGQGVLIAYGQANTSDHHGETHSCSIPHHEATAAKTIDHEEGNKGGEEVFGTEDAGKETCEGRVKAEGIFKDDGCICDCQ